METICLAEVHPLPPASDADTSNIRLKTAFLAATAGCEFRKGAVEKKFWAVPATKSGFGQIHSDHECEHMLAVTNAGAAATQRASELASLKLTGPKTPAIEAAWGVYSIKSKSYAAAFMKFEARDIIPRDEIDAYLEGRAADGSLAIAKSRRARKGTETRTTVQQLAQHAQGEGIAYYMVLRRENTGFKKTCFGRWLQKRVAPVVYTLTVSHNGVVRFHLPNTTPVLVKLAALYNDSERGCCTAIRNLRHALKHGCFCMGLFYEAAAA